MAREHAFGAILIATLSAHHAFSAGRYSGDATLRLFWLVLLFETRCRRDDLQWAFPSEVFRMMFRVPMPNPSLNLTDKIEAALLSQVSAIADQVCDGMFVTGATAPLKNRDRLGGPRNWFALSGMLVLRLGY